MSGYSSSNPLPMRFPATNPPVKGDHIDIGVWPEGWRFMRLQDRQRWEALPADDREMFQAAFDRASEQLAAR